MMDGAINCGGAGRRQRGMSLFGWLLALVIAGLFALAAVHLVPAYIEAGEISSTLHSVRDKARTESISQIRNALVSQLDMNNLNAEVPLSEFKFESNGNTLKISVDHDIDTAFIGNLGFVIHVHRSMTVKRAEQF